MTLAGAEECLSAAALFHLKIFLIKSRCSLCNYKRNVSDVFFSLLVIWTKAGEQQQHLPCSVLTVYTALPYLICTSSKGKPILLAAFSLLIILKLTLISVQCDLRLFDALLFSHWLYSGTSYRSKCCIFSHEKINSMYSATDYVLSWRLTTLVINNGGCTASVTAAGLAGLQVCLLDRCFGFDRWLVINTEIISIRLSGLWFTVRFAVIRFLSICGPVNGAERQHAVDPLQSFIVSIWISLIRRLMSRIFICIGTLVQMFTLHKH